MFLDCPIRDVGAEAIGNAGTEPMRINGPPRSCTSRPKHGEDCQEDHLLGQIKSIQVLAAPGHWRTRTAMESPRKNKDRATRSPAKRNQESLNAKCDRLAWRAPEGPAPRSWERYEETGQGLRRRPPARPAVGQPQSTSTKAGRKTRSPSQESLARKTIEFAVCCVAR